MPRHETRTGDARERRLAWDVLRNSTTLRMAAAMRGPWPLARRPSGLTSFRNNAFESDRHYYQRRAEEEHRASNAAAGTSARKAHRELARLYARRAKGHAAPLSGARH